MAIYILALLFAIVFLSVQLKCFESGNDDPQWILAPIYMAYIYAMAAAIAMPLSILLACFRWGRLAQYLSYLVLLVLFCVFYYEKNMLLYCMLCIGLGFITTVVIDIFWGKRKVNSTRQPMFD